LIFLIIITLFILQRLVELYISKRNERWLLAQGAVEYGKAQYPFMLLLHTGFIVFLITEYYIFPVKYFAVEFLIAFIMLLLLKVWVIGSLGHYWNTKIYRIPGSVPVASGPYKYFKHPNYMIVISEVFIFPLIFHLFYTAIIFSLLNAVMLNFRIKEENKVWAEN
jgi:methyltransferase